MSKTTSKAERFVQTSLREWAYVRPYESSAEHGAALQPLLTANWLGQHPAANHKPAITSIRAVSNLLGFDIYSGRCVNASRTRVSSCTR
jgi:hypothetical protein